MSTFNKNNVHIGQKFHKWTVIEEPFAKNGSAYVKCQCECKKNTIKELKLSALQYGGTKSCGCTRVESISNSLRKGTLAENNMKKCGCCLEIKSTDNFYTCKKKSDGYQSTCQLCMKNQRYITKYNISLRAFNNLKQIQCNKCLICQRTFDEIEMNGELAVIDHNHAINKKHIRGILCNKCNSAIGLLQESIDILKNTIRYLSRDSVILTENNQTVLTKIKNI